MNQTRIQNSNFLTSAKAFLQVRRNAIAIAAGILCTIAISYFALRGRSGKTTIPIVEPPTQRSRIQSKMQESYDSLVSRFKKTTPRERVTGSAIVLSSVLVLRGLYHLITSEPEVSSVQQLASLSGPLAAQVPTELEIPVKSGIVVELRRFIGQMIRVTSQATAYKLSWSSSKWWNLLRFPVELLIFAASWDVTGITQYLLGRMGQGGYGYNAYKLPGFGQKHTAILKYVPGLSGTRVVTRFANILQTGTIKALAAECYCEQWIISQFDTLQKTAKSFQNERIYFAPTTRQEMIAFNGDRTRIEDIRFKLQTDYDLLLQIAPGARIARVNPASPGVLSEDEATAIKQRRLALGERTLMFCNDTPTLMNDAHLNDRRRILDGLAQIARPQFFVQSVGIGELTLKNAGAGFADKEDSKTIGLCRIPRSKVLIPNIDGKTGEITLRECLVRANGLSVIREVIVLILSTSRLTVYLVGKLVRFAIVSAPRLALWRSYRLAVVTTRLDRIAVSIWNKLGLCKLNRHFSSLSDFVLKG